MKKWHFVLEFTKGSPLPVKLDLPQKNVTVMELLPAIFTMADTIFVRSNQDLENMGQRISCGPNCGVCCHQMVPISEYEAVHLARVVRSLPEEQRDRVTTRFHDAVAKLEGNGLLSRLLDVFNNHAHDWRKVRELQKLYWDQRLLCPFVEDGSCSIHPMRPVTCRQYSVTSPPELCAHIYEDGTPLRVVRHPMDVGGALASFTGTGGQRSRVIPHILSLHMEGAFTDRPLPELPAKDMAARFLEFLARAFVSRPE